MNFNLDKFDAVMLCIAILLLVCFYFWENRQVFAVKCGHWTYREASFVVGGRNTLVRVDVDKNGETDYCLQCVARASIRCAWCEQPILAGEFVALSSPEMGKIPKKGAVPYADDKGDPRGRYLGCVRPTCRGTGMCETIWLPPGQVERLPRPIALRDI